MSDLISRQAAIDELDKGAWGAEWDKALAQAMLESLPSAQPEPIKVSVDREMTEEELKELKKKIADSADSTVVLLPSAQPEIIYCKDCVKHNKGHGYYCDGMSIGIKDCCPLVEIRGRAQGHEFDYQFCAYAERRQDV